MNFYDNKELDILRQAVDNASERAGKELIQSEDIKKIIAIVEEFIRNKKLICYGGTAINNILPTEDQFYNKLVEIPDYDFFSTDAMKDAKLLADIYYKAGFKEIEAKSGIHEGTYKVYVNYIPVADITHLEKEIFNNINNDSIIVSGIKYAPPNFLRMSMYLELSRPKGDVTRWEKVLKRLILLNKNFPLKGTGCHNLDFQRKARTKLQDKIFYIVKSTLINQGVVFFGGYASKLYSKYMSKNFQKKFKNIPDFDVLSESPHFTATIIKDQLIENNIKDVIIVKHKKIGEIVAPHYEIKVKQETICFIYEPLACHSYNILIIDKNKVKIASIDTMLSFYLAFLYTDRPYYDDNRIICMCDFLFKIQYKNRLNQKGLLYRFSIDCYGKQSTLTDARILKADMYKNLKKNSSEYNKWFFKYIPGQLKKSSKITNKKKTVKKTSKKKIRTAKKRKHSVKNKKLGAIEL